MQVKTPVGGDTQSRSILLVTLEEVDYLLVGLGDGHLVSFPIQVHAHTHAHTPQTTAGLWSQLC